MASSLGNWPSPEVSVAEVGTHPWGQIAPTAWISLEGTTQVGEMSEPWVSKTSWWNKACVYICMVDLYNLYRFICLYPLYYLIHIQDHILHHLHLCWRTTGYGDQVSQTQIASVDKHMTFELQYIFSNIHIYYSPQRLAIMLCHVNTIGMSVRREMQWSVAVDTFVHKWVLEFLLSFLDDNARSMVSCWFWKSFNQL